MVFDFPELIEILSEIEIIKQKLEPKIELPEWLNDEQCWKAKGGCALTTYRKNRFYQVKGGIPDGYVGGRKVWNKKTVLEWLPLTDEQLVEYHIRYKTGAKKQP